MEEPKKSKSLFANVTAKNYFITALVAFALDILISIATQSSRPTTKAEALIPGMLMGILGWIAIICLIAGIIKFFTSRKK